jgi:hypothetical protein
VKVQNEAILAVPPQGQIEEWKPLKLGIKVENVDNSLKCLGIRQQGKRTGIRGYSGNGPGKRAMKCDRSDKEGSGGERQSQ